MSIDRHLTSLTRPVVTREAVAWAATTGTETVMLAITHEALEALTESRNLSTGECLSAFDLHRPTIEQVAERVLTRRKPEGSRYVIGVEDLAELPARITGRPA
ncbi:DUF1488 family protein [Desertibaculum subflavum]|uniref:DUF1488 family protein n=1 Tax=Desertibaculum subflavum TaxID=2268458 RepID=UPI000E660AFC